MSRTTDTQAQSSRLLNLIGLPLKVVSYGKSVLINRGHIASHSGPPNPTLLYYRPQSVSSFEVNGNRKVGGTKVLTNTLCLQVSHV